MSLAWVPKSPGRGTSTHQEQHFRRTRLCSPPACDGSHEKSSQCRKKHPSRHCRIYFLQLVLTQPKAHESVVLGTKFCCSARLRAACSSALLAACPLLATPEMSLSTPTLRGSQCREHPSSAPRNSTQWATHRDLRLTRTQSWYAEPKLVTLRRERKCVQ